MPVKSKAQARFMRAVAAGDVKAKGLSREEAGEFVDGQSTKHLPERAKNNARSMAASKREARKRHDDELTREVHGRINSGYSLKDAAVEATRCLAKRNARE